MSSLFSLLFLAMIILFWIYWRRDKKEIGKITKRTWYVLATSVILFFLVGLIAPKNTQSKANNSSSSSSKKLTVSNKSEKSNSKVNSSKKKAQNDKSNLKSQAIYFGNRSVEYIQKRASSYSSMKIDNGMRYIYLVKDNSYLVRIDTDDGYTNVYSYDGNDKNELGDNLFTGRTIFNQPATKKYYYIGK